MISNLPALAQNMILNLLAFALNILYEALSYIININHKYRCYHKILYFTEYAYAFFREHSALFGINEFRDGVRPRYIDITPNILLAIQTAMNRNFEPHHVYLILCFVNAYNSKLVECGARWQVLSHYFGLTCAYLYLGPVVLWIHCGVTFVFFVLVLSTMILCPRQVQFLIPWSAAMYMVTFTIIALTSMRVFARTDNSNLVGIEPNPGPVVLSTLVPPSFTRNETFTPQSGWLPSMQHSIDDQTMYALTNLTAALADLSQSTRNGVTIDHNVAIPHVDSFISNLLDRFPQVKQCGKYFCILAVVCFGNYLVSSVAFQSGLTAGIVRTAGLAFGAYASFKFGSEFAKDFIFPLIEGWNPEGLPKPQVEAGTIVSILIAYLYSESAVKAYKKESIVGFMKTIGDMPKLENGLVRFVNGLLDLSQRFIDYVTTKAGIPAYVLKTSMFPELDAISEDLKNLVASFRSGASFNYDNGCQVFDLERRATTLLAKIPNSHEFSEYKKAAMSLLSIIKPLVSRMERNNIVGNGPRRPPLAIMLGGPTGVGKSTSTFPLLLAVNALVLPESKLKEFEKNHNDTIWNYVSENPFADSYHGQFNTIIDEAGAQNDSTGSPDAGAQAVLRLVNPANYPLHMANLEDKGNTNYNSDMLWATTNRTFFDWKSMYLPEAYARRFKLQYLCVPKKQYCTDATMDVQNPWDRRLDVLKIPVTADGFSSVVTDYIPWNYSPINPGRRPGKILEFDELVEVIAEAYRVHVAHEDKLLAFHSIIKDKYINMRREKNVSVDEYLSKPIDGVDSTVQAEIYNRHKEAEKFSPQVGGFQVEESFVNAIADYYLITAEEVKKAISTLGRVPERTKAYLDDIWSTHISAVCDHVEGEVDAWYKKILSFLCAHSPTLIAIAAAIPAAIVAWKFLGPMLFGSQAYGTRKVPKKNNRPRRARAVGIGPHNATFSTPQAGISQNCLDMANKLVRKNMYSLSCEGRKLGYFIFLAGRVGVFPEHFTYTLEDWIDQDMIDSNPKLVFKKVGAPEAGFEVFLDDVHIVFDPDSHDDINYVVMPKVCYDHPNIVEYLVDDDPLLYNKFNCALLAVPPSAGLNMPCSFSLVAEVAHPIGNQQYEAFSFESGYTYPIATREGDCGAPLFAMHPNGRPILAGLHVAGSGSRGMATRLYKRQVDKILDLEPRMIQSVIPPEPFSVAQVGSNVVTCEEVRKNNVPKSTKVIPSPLFEAWGPTDMAPPVLAPKRVDGVLIDPMALAREKYSGHGKAVNMDLLDCLAQQMIQEIVYVSSKDNPWPPRKLTFDEVVCGIDGVDFCDKIPRDTSPGYPRSLDTKLPGKKDWFGTDQQYSVDSPKALELRAEISTIEKDLRLGKRMSCAFADYLKDERRTKKKVRECKTRAIFAGPIDHLILTKMYFGDLIRWLNTNRIRNGMCIGLNAYSHEWTELHAHMTSIGDRQIFGDYSGFDKSLNCVFMYKFLELAEAFYAGSNDGDKMARAALFEDVVNSRHVADIGGANSVIYEWNGSNPSGNAITTPLNTFSNNLIMRYAYMMTIGKSLGYHHSVIPPEIYVPIMSTIPEDIRQCGFGDDGGMSVGERWAHVVNQTTITESMAEIGFTYTDEAKGGLQHVHRPIAECSFLKRGFRKEPVGNRVLAPLEIGVILDMPYWTKKGLPPHSVITTLETAMMELSLHGKETFDRYAPVFVEKSIQRLGHSPIGNFRHNLQKAKHCTDYY